jgi:hypothetical protein
MDAEIAVENRRELSATTDYVNKGIYRQATKPPGVDRSGDL